MIWPVLFGLCVVFCVIAPRFDPAAKWWYRSHRMIWWHSSVEVWADRLRAVVKHLIEKGLTVYESMDDLLIGDGGGPWNATRIDRATADAMFQARMRQLSRFGRFSPAAVWRYGGVRLFAARAWVDGGRSALVED